MVRKERTDGGRRDSAVILDGVNAYASAWGWAGKREHVIMMYLGGLSMGTT